MTCSSCVHLIEKTLIGTAGIEKAVVTLATNRGHIEFDPAILGARDIIKIVEVCTAEKQDNLEIICCLFISVLVSLLPCVRQTTAYLASAITVPSASGRPLSSSP